MAETITVKQLANRVGVEARVIRRILRSRFSREAKGKVYEWQPDDPQIALILIHLCQTRLPALPVYI